MPKRAAKKATRADDRRAITPKNPKTVAAPEAKKTTVAAVPSYKKSTPGGKAGRPKKVR